MAELLNFLTVLTLSLADTVSGKLMAELLDSPDWKDDGCLESTDTASGPWLSHLQEKKNGF